jgi:heme/copper-type cytochrome/quinol oxidase subunit 3
MNTVANSYVENVHKPLPTVLDQDRGTFAMLLVIFTELFLFISLFFSYFMLENNKHRWSFNNPPKLGYALVMVVVLVTSSFVLHWGEKQVEKESRLAGRIALAATIVIGLVFLTLQSFEYLSHWKTLAPYSDSYGSIFYAITTFHAAHVIVGLLLLSYVLALPRYAPARESPYRPYHVAAMYWHFVDIIWLFVVGILYIGANYHL